jgi:GNAT superfamily N-acetyltransferase
MYQIRKCHFEDFDDVVRLLGQLWPDKQLNTILLKTVFSRALNSESQEYLCAANGQLVIGFGSLMLLNNLWQEGYLGYVDTMIVDSEYRGRGIGTQLLEQLLAFARQNGCLRVELGSGFHRIQAHQFYERRGFKGRALLFCRVL